MRLPLAMLAFAIILLVGACDTPQPAGDATPPENLLDTGDGGGMDGY